MRAAQGYHAGAAKALKGLLEGEEDVREELESDARLRAVAALVLATSWVDVGEAGKLAQKELPAVDLEGGVVNPEGQLIHLAFGVLVGDGGTDNGGGRSAETRRCCHPACFRPPPRHRLVRGPKHVPPGCLSRTG